MAARMWDQVLTVWSTNPDKMEQLHCFSAVKYNCPVSMVEHEIYPIAFFEGDGRQQRRYKLQKYKYKYSLVVLEKVHSSWVQKTLTCFPITTLPPFLVTDRRRKARSSESGIETGVFQKLFCQDMMG